MDKPTYTFEINHKLTDLKIIEIDHSQRMADINRTNNNLNLPGRKINNKKPSAEGGWLFISDKNIIRFVIYRD